MFKGKLTAWFNKNRSGWVAVGLAGAFFLAIAAIPNYVPHRPYSASNVCINNLRQIDGAKQTWALEYHASSNTIPTWQNIQPYLGRGTAGTLPTCPQGGTYTIGEIRKPPTCSIKGHSLD